MQQDRLPIIAGAAGQPNVGSLPAQADDASRTVTSTSNGTWNASQLSSGRRCTPWLDLARMVGLPTSIWVTLATLLHGIDCELRSEVVHWSTATFLISISGTTAAVLWFVYRWSYRFLLLASLAGFGVLIGGRFITEFCETHHFFLSVLASVCLLCASASWWSQSSCSPSLALAKKSPESESESAAVDRSSTDEIPTESQATGTLASPTLPKWRRVAVPALLLAAFFIYMILVPTIEMWLESLRPTETFSKQLTDMTLAEKIRLHSVSGVVMLIFLATGASVGSFLNVVIYRLPRRRALLWPPSACPSCRALIAGKDNIPILAWLSLGGRCRNCCSSIPARYPLIEAVCAALFVLFFYRELLSGGENLAVRTPNMFNGIVWVLLYTKWDLVLIYTFHMVVLVVLLAWGMINFDRFAVPKHASLGVIVLSLGLVVVYPQLNPVTDAWVAGIGPIPAKIAGPLLGALVGAVCGYVLALMFPVRSPVTMALDAPLVMQSQQVGEPAALVSAEMEAEVDPHDLLTSSDPSLPATVESVSEAYAQPSLQPVRSCDSAASLALIGVAFGVRAALLIALAAAVVMLGLALGRRAILLFNPSSRIAAMLPVSLVLFWIGTMHLVAWSQLHLLTNKLYIAISLDLTGK